MPTQKANAPQEGQVADPGAPDEAPNAVYVASGNGEGKGILGVLLGLLVLAAMAMAAVYLLTLAASPQSHAVNQAAVAARAHPP